MRKIMAILLSIFTLFLVITAYPPLIKLLVSIVSKFLNFTDLDTKTTIFALIDISVLLPAYYAIVLPYRNIVKPEIDENAEGADGPSRTCKIAAIYVVLILAAVLGTGANKILVEAETNKQELEQNLDLVKKSLESLDEHAAANAEKEFLIPLAYEKSLANLWFSLRRPNAEEEEKAAIRADILLKCAALFYLLDENAKSADQERRENAEEEIGALFELSSSYSITAVFSDSNAVQGEKALATFIDDQVAPAYLNHISTYRDWIIGNGITVEALSEAGHPLQDEYRMCDLTGDFAQISLMFAE